MTDFCGDAALRGEDAVPIFAGGTRPSATSSKLLMPKHAHHTA